MWICGICPTACAHWVPLCSLCFSVLEVSVDIASSSEILSSAEPFKGFLHFFYSVFDLGISLSFLVSILKTLLWEVLCFWQNWEKCFCESQSLITGVVSGLAFVVLVITGHLSNNHLETLKKKRTGFVPQRSQRVYCTLGATQWGCGSRKRGTVDLRFYFWGDQVWGPGVSQVHFLSVNLKQEWEFKTWEEKKKWPK